MWIVWVVCGLIVAAVIGLSLFTTHKGYQYEHTIDPLPDRPYQENEKNTEETKPDEKNKSE